MRNGRPSGPNRLRWMAALAVLPVIALLVVLAWWLLLRGANDDGPGVGGLKPIARLNAPDVHSLLIDPTDPEHVLFGSHAGIMESRDGGFVWQPGNLRDADAMNIASSLKDGDTLYVTGHDVFQVSHDSGRNWRPLTHDLPGTDLHAFAQDPADPRRLYAYVAGDRIYASSDAGETWESLPAQPGGQPLALATTGTALYVATPTGIEASLDGGVTWSRLTNQPSGGAFSLAVTEAEPQVIYAGTPTGVAKST
ncbi:MAG: YCF48-related protein, partial [Gemmatimonadota bacterium]|nr:YCF48-related protein [Gemmatimonadota bacterium]